MESHLMKCISDGYPDTPRCMDVPFMCPWIRLTPFWCDDFFRSMAYIHMYIYIYVCMIYIYCIYIYISTSISYTYIPFGPLRFQYIHIIYAVFVCVFQIYESPHISSYTCFHESFPITNNRPEKLIGWATLGIFPSRTVSRRLKAWNLKVIVLQSWMLVSLSSRTGSTFGLVGCW